MAKIDYFIPEPTDEFSPDNQRQILQALATLKSQLNTSYQQDLKNEQEGFAWFLIGTGKVSSTNISNGALPIGFQLNISLNSVTITTT